jgi:hypothetical protein
MSTPNRFGSVHEEVNDRLPKRRDETREGGSLDLANKTADELDASEKTEQATGSDSGIVEDMNPKIDDRTTFGAESLNHERRY